MGEYLRAMNESVGLPFLVQVERAARADRMGLDGGDEAARSGKHQPAQGKDKGKEKERQPPRLEVDGELLDTKTTERILAIFRTGLAGCPSKKDAREWVE